MSEPADAHHARYFHRCLELAVEGFHAGSFPVGAVLLGTDGQVIAEGRNRMGEPTAPEGRLRNTALAHAEMDVMAQLRLGDYEDTILYTSLEPCLLCQAALTMTHIGEVRYLAPDSICIGLDRLPEINEHARRRYPTIVGPFRDPRSVLAQILPMAVFVLFNRNGDTIADYRRHAPDAVAAAERVVDERLWPERGEPLDELVERFASLVDER